MTDVETARAVRRGTLRLARRLRAERGEPGLSHAKISVLGQVAHREGISPGELAAAERVQPQSLTRVLAELEADGLLQRRPGLADGRQRRLHLTAAGRSALARDMAPRDEWLAGAMAG